MKSHYGWGLVRRLLPVAHWNRLWQTANHHPTKSWRTEENQFLQVHLRSHFKITTATRISFHFPVSQSAGLPDQSLPRDEENTSDSRYISINQLARFLPYLLIGMKIDSFLGFRILKSVSNSNWVGLWRSYKRVMRFCWWTVLPGSRY